MKTQSFLPEHLSRKEIQYWSSELSKPLPTLDIPTDFPIHAKRSLNKLSTTTFLEEELVKGLKRVHSEFNLHTILLAAYFAWNARLSNEEDIIVGININGNICPIRISTENTKNFEDLLILVEEKLENAYDHCFIAEEIVNANETLFQTTFCMNLDEKLENDAMLNWEIHEQETYTIISVQYDPDLFKRKTIERFISYYLNIIKAVLVEPKINIYKISILTEEELEIYNELNSTHSPFPSSKSISQMFEEAVHKFPGNIAISSEKGQFTYKELNERANCLANELIQKGLKKGDFVSIFMERSLETIISIFGILKAGGVYVPVDPEHPEDRNAYIISDTKSPFVITKNLYLEKARDLLSNNMYVKEIILVENLNNFLTENPNINIMPEDLAYVIYTSGSTGKPKGTLIAHQGVVNLGFLIHNEYKIDEKEILTQFSTYSFDASVWDTFGSLFWGARLHLLSKEERISVADFANAIERTKATFITILPTVFFNELATQLSEEDIPKLSTVQRVAVGGEALSGEVVRSFQKKFQNSIEIINLYGPTESTVVATGYRISDLIPEEQANIPIGKPFSNYKVYIVNEENQICPFNVPGEICISSVGLARGYLNQEEKTKEVFCKNPFENSGLIYKTGDIARILESGFIEYVGRKDSQVKVLGHRIEIGEVENNFAKHPEVQDIAVIPKNHNNKTVLAAYYTSKNNKPLKASDLKSFLQERVPFYMIPKYMNRLEKMPVSPTGKIDRKTLATFDYSNVEQDENYVAPQNEIQEVIADAWGKVLELKKVGINDDFFDIGGHSLNVMSILVLLKPHFPNLKINDFFTHKTISDLSERVKELEQKNNTTNKKNENGIWKTKDLNEYPGSFNCKVQMNGCKKPENILLTGATGYLGAHILNELIKNTNAKVYCLIRKSDNKTLLEKLSDTMTAYFGEEILRQIKERVITIEGDLENDKLGLSLTDQNFIKENIDTIIHTAADVRHFGDVSHFNKVNIQGTKHLLDLTKSNSQIRFHHISTLGVPEDLAAEGKWEEVIKEPKFSDDLKLENIYTNSKLMAEKLIYKAGNEGAAITVYRAGNLTCRSIDGLFQKNINNNAFYRLIKSMILLGKAPKINCYLDLTPIDYASKIIVNLVCRNDTIGETFHICNPDQILYSSFIDAINNFGYKVELIDQTDYEKWLLDSSISKNQEGLELAMAQLEGSDLRDSGYRFACSNTMKYMDSSYLKLTRINQDFVNKMLNYAVEIGYFPKP